MTGLARFLIRLYPREWRARYGEEFSALIEDSPVRVSTIFDLTKGMIRMQASVRNFPRLALLLSIAGLLAGLGASFLVTPRYTSMVELKIMDAGDGSTAAAHFGEIRNDVLSRSTLSTIIQDPRLDLYRREREKEPLEDIIETMRTRDIRTTLVEHLEGPRESYADFRIQCTYSKGRVAQEIAQTLVIKFEEDNETKQRDAAWKTQGSDRVTQLEARIAVLEQRLGIASRSPGPYDQPILSGGLVQMVTIDPPNLPIEPNFPNRPVFMAGGFGAGFLLAVVIAVARRPLPLPPPELA